MAVPSAPSAPAAPSPATRRSPRFRVPMLPRLSALLGFPAAPTSSLPDAGLPGAGLPGFGAGAPSESVRRAGFRRLSGLWGTAAPAGPTRPEVVVIGAGIAGLFHKIVCRATPGTATFGRPGFAHLLAFSRDLRVPPAMATPDVLPALGEMSWSKAMGTAACEAAVAFLARATACRTVVDPFCGLGTVLAVANARGLDAVGVECVRRRAARARRLRYDPATGLA